MFLVSKLQSTVWNTTLETFEVRAPLWLLTNNSLLEEKLVWVPGKWLLYTTLEIFHLITAEKYFCNLLYHKFCIMVGNYGFGLCLLNIFAMELATIFCFMHCQDLYCLWAFQGVGLINLYLKIYISLPVQKAIQKIEFLNLPPLSPQICHSALGRRSPKLFCC